MNKSSLTSPDINKRPIIFGKAIAKIIISEKSTTAPKLAEEPITTKIMTPNPLFISENSTASKALAIMNKKKITSLLVTPERDLNKKNKKLIGIVHIHSILQFGIK